MRVRTATPTVSRSSRLRKPCGSKSKRSRAAEEALHPPVAEAERRGALAVDAHRTVQLVEHVGSEGTVVAEALDAQQASVGGEADLLQIIEVPQPAADREVVRVVDDRLGAQGAPFLVVLLDARVLVVDVQRRDDPVGDDAGCDTAMGCVG